MQNPFKILGFSPSAFRGLSDENVSALVKAQYRVLSGIHHPDKGGNRKQFEAVAWAAEQLDSKTDPGRFRYWYDVFTKPRKEQISMLEEEVEEREQDVETLQERMTTFWGTVAANVLSDQATIFNLPPTRFLVSEDVAQHFFGAFLIQRRRADGDQGNPSPALMDGISESFELVTDSKGCLTKYSVEQVRFDARKETPPNLPKGWVYVSENVPWQSRYWRRTGDKQPLDGLRLIGTIRTKDLPAREFGELKMARLIPGDMSVEQLQYTEEGFPLMYFRSYLPFLMPVINPLAWLVAVRRMNDELRFAILGRVRQIALVKK